MRDARRLKTMKEMDRRNMIKVLSVEVAESLDLDERQNAYRQTLWYLFTKALFLINIILQFVLLDAFIGRGFVAWCWNAFLSVFGMNNPREDRW